MEKFLMLKQKGIWYNVGNGKWIVEYEGNYFYVIYPENCINLNKVRILELKKDVGKKMIKGKRGIKYG
ncbi:MAG: hypothetical protein ABIL45_04215 [candidate division WOR-3 bacterium]